MRRFAVWALVILNVGFAWPDGADARPKARREVARSKLLDDARAAYAKGDFTRAIQFYEVIPASSADYLRSKEELAWAYLRAKEFAKLKGSLEHLNSPLVPLRWRLEGRVLAAMLNLKDCRYDHAQGDIGQFQKELAPLVRILEKKLAGKTHLDYWRALKGEVDEAIFKMKFVKMEIRSRLLMISRQQPFNSKSENDTSEKVARHEQTFPLGDDLWVDELFHGRGEEENLCAKIHDGVMR